MWLLNTHTAELKFFSTPADVPGGYAILSHVWGSPEKFWGLYTSKEDDTFQTVQSAFEECQGNARNPTNMPASAIPSDRIPVVATSALSSEVRSLSDQVQNLTAQLQALICTLQIYDPALAVLLSTPPFSTPTPQCLPASNIIGDAPAVLPRVDARDRLSTKIRNFLLQAERHGLDWAWADTCCIDKTSSAEVTEAISSMFQYYARSEVCYAYLSDVRPPKIQGEMSWEFKNSHWHQRGWTLQELIAPKVVIFMAKDWTPLGTKYDLADMMEKDIKGCPPASVLRFKATCIPLPFLCTAQS